MLKISAFYNANSGSFIARHPGAIAELGGVTLPISLTKTEDGFNATMPFPGGKLIIQATEGRHENVIYAVGGLSGEQLFAHQETSKGLVFSTKPNWRNPGLLVASITGEGLAELSQIRIDGNTVKTSLVWRGNVKGRKHLLGIKSIPAGLGVLTAALRRYNGQDAHYVRAA